MSIHPLQRLLDEGAAGGVYPMAQAQVIHRGSILFSGQAGGASAATTFDLASLTKVMCTTAAFLSLWAERRLHPDTRVETIFPKAAARGAITLADLLFHRSGLPAFQPLFAEVLERFPELREPTCSAETRIAAREETVRRAVQLAPEQPRGVAAVYSDIGFIVLGEVLSAVSGQPLDELFLHRVAMPLGLGARFFRISSGPISAPERAPTGRARPRDPAPGQELLWNIASITTEDTAVDDDNAWVMDGVAGHAGLFGTAADVATFGQAVLLGLEGASPLAPKELWHQCVQRDPETPKSTRALGFDTPSDSGSSAGRFIGCHSLGAVGHLGFTGCSLWVDIARELVVALLTNRTWTGRNNNLIREFRPRFHDEVIQVLSLS